MNGEWARICKGVTVTYVIYFSGIHLEGLRKATRSLGITVPLAGLPSEYLQCILLLFQSV